MREWGSEGVKVRVKVKGMKGMKMRGCRRKPKVRERRGAEALVIGSRLLINGGLPAGGGRRVHSLTLVATRKSDLLYNWIGRPISMIWVGMIR